MSRCRATATSPGRARRSPDRSSSVQLADRLADQLAQAVELLPVHAVHGHLLLRAAERTNQDSATEWAAAELLHPGGVERNLEHLRAGLWPESPGAEHVDARCGRSDPVRTRDEHEDDVSERAEEQQDLQAGTPALREEHRLDRLPQAVRLLDAGDRLLRAARVRELGHPAAAA